MAAVGTASLAVITTVPTTAGAFWPFTIARGASEGSEPPILHDETLPLLKAAVNSDPNPVKGGFEIAMSEGSALMANSGPEGTLPYRESGAKNGQISLYTVREGDTLSEIAGMFGVSVNTIIWANDLSSKTVNPGVELLILPVSGVQHTVASGDTLGGIAKKYDADAEEIALYNGLASSVDLKKGAKIVIPGGELTAKPKAAAKSSSTAKSSSALPALTGYFSNPLPGGRITQGVHGYNGVDVGAPSGTPIYAAAAGTVIVAKSGGGYNGGYGNYIVIKHDNGTQTLYAHMSKLAVGAGTVEKGDVIGYVGNTGKSTGYHLHFEVRGAKNPLAR